MAAAVTSVLIKLADILRENLREVQAVRGQIEQVQKDLDLIKALLKDVDPKGTRNNVVTEWLNQVNQIADKIATVIDTFRVKIEENRAESSNWVFKKFTKAYKNYKKYKLGLPDELKNIIEELDRLYKRRNDLRIEDLGAIDDVDDVDDPEVVGVEDDQAKIIEQLLDRSISRRTVLSIVGIGGLGKTTLAQKVYKSDKLERQFDCRAWLSISQTFVLNKLFREILYKVKPQMKKKNPPDRDLLVQLKNYFLEGKRYLIILDDVWDIDLWRQLEKALPDMGKASRVIITTRLLYVAKVADCNTKPYKLRYLSGTEGRDLLFRKAFQQHDVQPENYPHLLDVAERLTKKCGGLPLALVVLGGILTMRDRNYTAWNTLYESIDWQDEDGIKCSQVLARSYEDLPRYLKDCFLYFAAFPEDYQISGEHVTRMWMAEEFVPKVGAGTIEYKVEKCLEELVQRCLIQVIKKSWKGNCKYCNMHDLLRDLAITKAKEENFFTVFSKDGEDVNQLPAIKPRRAALQFSRLTQDGVYSENNRSLLCFGVERSAFLTDDHYGFGKLNYSGFSILRVLTLQSVGMSGFTQRQWTKGLVHLRFLGLRDCKIPKDFFKKFSFYNLETIDLKGSKSVDGTIVLDFLIPTLKHVYGDWDFDFRLKWNQHTNLQTLDHVLIQIDKIVELACCINLRTLMILFKENKDYEINVPRISNRAIRDPQMWQNFKAVLRRTEQLVYFGILQPNMDVWLYFDGTTDLPCHGKIQKLCLNGFWNIGAVPRVEMFPPNLTKLRLISSNLKKDPMPILEKLPSLRILRLASYSYVGKELICSTGGFPNLEKLCLICLWDLCHWDIKDGAMPVLRHLKIDECKRLNALPELQKVPTLQELVVNYPSRELRESMQGDKDLHKINHIPFVRRESGWDAE